MQTSSSPTKQNVGRPDRSIRVVVGLVLLALAIFSLNGVWALVAGLVGAILIGTGLYGFCPLYRLLGMNTCPVR